MQTRSEQLRTASEHAVLLGWDYKDWQGMATKDLLANTERKNMMERTLTCGSLSLDLFKQIESNHYDSPSSNDISEAINSVSGGDDVSINKEVSRKRTGTENEDPNPAKLRKHE
ncbi:hypothetical protein Aduo_015621 [Ancylostoma duodenale]